MSKIFATVNEDDCRVVVTQTHIVLGEKVEKVYSFPFTPDNERGEVTFKLSTEALFDLVAAINGG